MARQPLDTSFIKALMDAHGIQMENNGGRQVLRR
jgi:hypothetical protein